MLYLGERILTACASSIWFDCESALAFWTFLSVVGHLLLKCNVLVGDSFSIEIDGRPLDTLCEQGVEGI